MSVLAHRGPPPSLREEEARRREMKEEGQPQELSSKALHVHLLDYLIVSPPQSPHHHTYICRARFHDSCVSLSVPPSPHYPSGEPAEK
ncbi:hypothetical protein HYQ45_018104 [Verticillium longisporum]|uniref:Uncharacterized protein n=1 Tax=Verticillium longisporum TaxID=100787 RepID=A0A8I2Z4M5_VERLO|nr:hypothetical protein HYQ45_018104 [Verticillium longisporum]KAG7111984.1 hypothetical protein HYQ44_010179 [Verticillium longisporum]KAG7152342.1 hypothetical protein HYQ46_011819 [Verticillium longisporum]